MHAAVDSGCNENVHRDVRTFKLRRVLVATEVMALWRRSGDGRALRTHALLAMERRIIHSGLSVRRSGGISAGDLPQPDYSGVWMPTSAVWAFHVKLTPNRPGGP